MFVGTIGLRIKELREKKHWSQRSLAEKAGVTLSHIGLIESGRIRNPRYDTLLKVMDALGCSRTKFFAKEEEADDEHQGQDHPDPD